MAVVGYGEQVVLVDDRLGDQVQGDLHVFVAFHVVVQVEILVVDD